MAQANSTSREPDERTIVITRVFDAPRDLVFKAWTDPKHVAQWWGPQGFTNPLCEMDLRVGGVFRVHMRGPDGVTYPCKGVYREVRSRSGSSTPARPKKAASGAAPGCRHARW